MGADDKKAAQEKARAELTVARDVYREQSRLNRDLLKSQAQMALESSRQVAADANAKIKGNLQLKLASIREVASAEKAAAAEAGRNARAALAEQGRNARDEARRQAREARGGGSSGGFGGYANYRAGRAIVGGAAHAFTSSISAGLGFAGQLARGAGVDFDLGAAVHRNVERQKLSQELVNSGYQMGASGPAGVRQNAGDISGEASKVGAEWGIDPTKILDAHKAFVSVTGDLQTSRDLMGDLAKLSTATGSNVEDVAKAAAKVSAQLPDTADKGKKVLEVMQAVASQGKLGGAEMFETAKQMAALAAVSNKFGGDSAKNMKLMGVLYQEAIQKGGAKGPAQAATSVASFVNAFSKDARINAMAALGVHPRDAKTGMLKNPEETIIALLRATGGRDDKGLNKAVADVRAKTAIAGFQNTFLAATGGKTDKASIDKGEAAVRAEFERLGKQLMDNAEIEKEAAARMEDTDKKAQQFQIAIDQAAKKMQADLLPTLTEMAPKMIQLVNVLGGVASFAANNPFLAITAATGAGAVKAGLGEILSRAMMGGMGAGGGAGGVGGLAGGGGAMGIMGATFATTAAIVALGLAADQAQKLWNETHEKTTFAAGTSPEEQARLLGLTREQKQGELAAHRNKADLEAGGYQTDDKDRAGPVDPRVAGAVDPKRLIDLNDQQLKALQGELRVRITNVDEIKAASGEGGNGAPILNPDGTTGGRPAPGASHVNTTGMPGFG